MAEKTLARLQTAEVGLGAAQATGPNVSFWPSLNRSLSRFYNWQRNIRSVDGIAIYRNFRRRIEPGRRPRVCEIDHQPYAMAGLKNHRYRQYIECKFGRFAGRQRTHVRLIEAMIWQPEIVVRRLL